MENAREAFSGLEVVRLLGRRMRFFIRAFVNESRRGRQNKVARRRIPRQQGRESIQALWLAAIGETGFPRERLQTDQLPAGFFAPPLRLGASAFAKSLKPAGKTWAVVCNPPPLPRRIPAAAKSPTFPESKSGERLDWPSAPSTDSTTAA